MDKQAFLDALMEKLRGELRLLVDAAEAAHEAATHEEAVAEDQYDTRGLEASYLAGAQAARARELRGIIAIYRDLTVRAFGEDDEIGLTALIGLASGAETRLYFLGPQGGGLRVPFAGHDVLVITPRSPLGSQLIGLEVGDEVTLGGADGRTLEVIEIH